MFRVTVDGETKLWSDELFARFDVRRRTGTEDYEIIEEFDPDVE